MIKRIGRRIGPGFALSRNYILDTFDSMLLEMRQKVGADKKDENFKFLVGETIMHTLGLSWEPGHGGRFQNIPIIQEMNSFDPERVALIYKEEETRNNYYRFKQDYRPIIHSDKFTSINILRDLDIMLDRMDDYVRDRYYIKAARRRYQLRMGIGLYRKLKETVWNGSGFVRTYKDIPLFLDYDKHEEYVIELEFKEGDNLDMPYGYYNKAYDSNFIKQTLNNAYGIKAFDNVKPTKVIFNGPATIVFWSDKTKTIVKRADDELDDKEKALAMCLLKKNKEMFKLCRKEAAKQEDEVGKLALEEVYLNKKREVDVIKRLLNKLTGGKDGN